MNFLYSWGRRLFSERGQQVLAAGLVLLCLLPFVVLAFDSHPALDDFSDAVTRRTMGLWRAQRYLYLHWTGRYTTSLLLMEASPLRWAADWPRYYFLVGWSALLMLAGGIYACWTALTGAAWSHPERALATGITLALWLAQAPSVAECLYWYNAVAVYTWPAALLLWWLVELANLVRTAPETRGHLQRAAVTGALGVAVVGCNEITALLVLASLGYALLWVGHWQRQQLPAIVGLLVVALLAAAVSFLAPGNGQRLVMVAHQPAVLRTLADSFGSAIYLSLNWLGTGLLLVATALALPALARLIARPATGAHGLSRVPVLWVAGGLLAVLMLVGTPSYWATGGMMPLRARTVVWLFFIVGWVALSVAGLGAATRRWPALQRLPAGWPRPIAAALWGALLLAFLTDHNVRIKHELMGLGSNTVVVAYRDWLSGAAARYNQQQQARYRLLQAQPARRLHLAALATEPPTLLYFDITPDSAYWGNVAYAHYFQQQAVWVDSTAHTKRP